MKPRAVGVDVLRAVALLAVVIVNVAGYRALPDAGPLPALGPGDGAAAFALTALVATLLQGKGVALLTFLFGYSLALGRTTHARSRLNRLLAIGLLHGFALYCGDILSFYALCGLAVLRHRRSRLRSLCRRIWVWGLLGSLLTGLLVALLPDLGGPSETTELALVDAQTLQAWWVGNASAYGVQLLALPLYFLLGYPLLLAGLLAGRLQLLQHRRWRPLWQRALRRWGLPLLLVNLVYGLAYAQALQDGDALPVVVGLSHWVGVLSLIGLIPWVLLRDWPAWLQRAGRNTLSPYLVSSVAAVALGMLWQPGLAAAYGFALWVWLLLSAWGASAERLPLEAWLARRPPA